MFRVNRVVVYPFSGAGKIVERYSPKGQDKEYYKVELNFAITSASISSNDLTPSISS